jgi:hypothetical protein
MYKKLTSQTIDTIEERKLEQAVVGNIVAKMLSDLSDEYDIVMKLSKSQQAIYVIWLVESEVNNGGFNQFFYNSSREFAEYMVEAFTTIGAVKFSNLVQQAYETYKREKEKISKQQDGSSEGFSKSYEKNPLNKYDDEFYALYKKEDLNQLKIDFIRNYKIDFIDN